MNNNSFSVVNDKGITRPSHIEQIRLGKRALEEAEPIVMHQMTVQKIASEDSARITPIELVAIIGREMTLERASNNIGYTWESPHLRALREFGAWLPQSAKKRGQPPLPKDQVITAALLYEEMTAQEAALRLDFDLDRDGQGNESGSVKYRYHKRRGLDELKKLKAEYQAEFKLDDDGLPEMYIDGVLLPTAINEPLFQSTYSTPMLIDLRNRIRQRYSDALQKEVKTGRRK